MDEPIIEEITGKLDINLSVYEEGGKQYCWFGPIACSAETREQAIDKVLNIIYEKITRW